MSESKKSRKFSLKKENDKKIVIQKSGRSKKPHAKMGKVSCVLACTSLGFLGAAVLISFFEYKEAEVLIGGLGASSIVLSFMGIKASVRGRKEKDKRHLTCNIGGISNILLLVGLVIIYII